LEKIKIRLKSALIELHYLPCIEYFCALQSFDEVVLEKHEHFEKQTYRNRCYINTAHGKVMLSIPLAEKHGKVVVKDIRIDYSSKWQNNQWRTIESAYRNAPYYEHYSQDIHKALYKGYAFLFDLNLHLLSFCLQSLRWSKKYSETVSYKENLSDIATDLRSIVNAKKSHTERPFYKPVSYYQVFGNGFAENLSLLDLLFSEGPRAPLVISQSRKQNLNN
jgi:WbqC-like protein family